MLLICQTKGHFKNQEQRQTIATHGAIICQTKDYFKWQEQQPTDRQYTWDTNHFQGFVTKQLGLCYFQGLCDKTLVPCYFQGLCGKTIGPLLFSRTVRQNNWVPVKSQYQSYRHRKIL